MQIDKETMGDDRNHARKALNLQSKGITLHRDIPSLYRVRSPAGPPDSWTSFNENWGSVDIFQLPISVEGFSDVFLFFCFAVYFYVSSIVPASRSYRKSATA